MNPEKERIIFHIDCNAFFASVEEILSPELKKVPMAVCGNPESRRGIILAKNELAKGFGIKTAETIWQAKRKCPGLVLRPVRHRLYTEYSERINTVYGEYTDLVERFGRDESYLDVTGSIRLFGGDPAALAHTIRERIPREFGLTVSVGVSFNKIFAKLASDLKKPNAVSIITRDNFRDVVWPMPVSALLMVGESTANVLHSIGISTIGDLAKAKETTLERKLGKFGELLFQYANGTDTSPVRSADEIPDVHSIGNGMTFKRNLYSQDDIKTAVTALADTVASRLRQQGLKCLTVQITIKDPELKVITRQKAAAGPTWLASELARESLSLIEASWSPGKPIRLLTVTAQKLVPADAAREQLNLFQEPDQKITRQKKEKLERAIDTIRDKYGTRSISPGNVIGNDLGINEDYSFDE
ncbi:DNA polymerase IV [Breznakiella homolactica]|uniref:DNA polymerase IV n=1 Tax=Breznakiella homolactica TaxID=2798577 RepID=A0A7T7XL93_9SPIR|nr:DNA polymerase IV [Breznakiella homolactica]QQO08474.1 DNA polymerase IV [Breznakiella homolactica]